MNKLFKRLAAIVAAAAMVMAMGITAFAEETHTVALYKDGTYESGSPVESMGNGALTGVTVEQTGTNTYVITVGLDENFKAYGIKSSMQSVTVEGMAATMLDKNNNGTNDAFRFTYTGEMIYPKMFNVSFTLKASIMPISAEGDLVIF